MSKSLLYVLIAISLLIYWKTGTQEGTSFNSDTDSDSNDVDNKKQVIEGFAFGRGARGLRGDQGPPGTRGSKGDAGPAGPPGPMGPAGPKGPTGKRGMVGVVGPRGKAGPRGERGFDGFPGPQGPGGDRGPRGDRGREGAAGLDGKPGPRGEAGPRGWPGLKGDPGTFAENSCKFFGSDEKNGWRCPASYPVYAGATVGNTGSKMYCSGGVARNATCNGSSGSGVRAKASVNGGKISDIRILDGGRNFKSSPYIRLVGGGGYGGILKAEINNGQVTSVVIVDGGKEYKNAPEVEFETVDAGYGASAEAMISGGQVNGVNIVNTGQNYQLAPHVEFRGGGGSGAEAIADINEGHIVSIRMLNLGSGYTYPPTVIITPNPAKAGCNYCHMCCKETPKQKNANTLQKQYEERIHQNEQAINKLTTELSNQHRMFQLSLRSGREERQVKKKEKKTLSSKTPTLSDSDLVVPTNQAQRRSQYYKKEQISDKELREINRKNDARGQGVDLAEYQKYEKKIAQQKYSQAERKKRLAMERKRLNLDGEIDWASRSKATQSSTYKRQGARNAIDGNLDTYSQTKLEQSNSWYQLSLPQTIEINRIVISNKLGDYNIRARLVPFKLVVLNSNGAEVGSKIFRQVLNKYTWDNINLVGKRVRLEQLDKNYLHLSGIEVRGLRAKKCSDYEEHYTEIKNTMKEALIKQSDYNPKSKVQRDKYKQLWQSCIKLNTSDKAEREKAIKAEAAAYDKILADQAATKKKKAAKAKKLWKKVQNQQAKEKKANKEAQEIAKKLGLPPPKPMPPRYSDAQIAIIKRTMKVGNYNFTDAKKAMCMGLLRNAMKKRSSAESYGKTAAFIPFLRPKAKRKGKHSEHAWDKYNRLCGDDSI